MYTEFITNKMYTKSSELFITNKMYTKSSDQQNEK